MTARKGLFWLAGGVAAILAVLAFLVLRELTRAGAFTTFFPRGTEGCSRIGSFPGAEDITIDRRTGWAFVSVMDWRAYLKDEPASGAIGAIDLGADEPEVILLRIDGAPQGLRPHGLSLWSDGAGDTRLFVVNHDTAGPRIEIFAVGEAEGVPVLSHLATVTGEALVSPNDVAAVGPRAFYVTNDHGSTGKGARLREEIFRKDLASLAYFDGERMVEAVSGLTYANGVTVSADGRTLVLAETLDGMLRFYARDPVTGGLTPKEGPEGFVWLGTAPDNIELAADGSLVVAAHPDILAFVGLQRNPEAQAPSQVLHVRPHADRPGGRITELLLEPGALFSAATTATIADGRILAVSLFEPALLVCPLEEGAQPVQVP